MRLVKRQFGADEFIVSAQDEDIMTTTDSEEMTEEMTERISIGFLLFMQFLSVPVIGGYLSSGQKLGDSSYNELYTDLFTYGHSMLFSALCLAVYPGSLIMCILVAFYYLRMLKSKTLKIITVIVIIDVMVNLISGSGLLGHELTLLYWVARFFVYGFCVCVGLWFNSKVHVN